MKFIGNLLRMNIKYEWNSIITRCLIFLSCTTTMTSKKFHEFLDLHKKIKICKLARRDYNITIYVSLCLQICRLKHLQLVAEEGGLVPQHLGLGRDLLQLLDVPVHGLGVVLHLRRGLVHQVTQSGECTRQFLLDLMTAIGACHVNNQPEEEIFDN